MRPQMENIQFWITHWQFHNEIASNGTYNNNNNKRLLEIGEPEE